MHPLTPELSGVSTEDLYKRVSELTGKLTFAYRMGQGDLVAQIQLVLQDYQMELEKRNREMLEKNTPFKDKIDITK